MSILTRPEVLAELKYHPTGCIGTVSVPLLYPGRTEQNVFLYSLSVDGFVIQTGIANRLIDVIGALALGETPFAPVAVKTDYPGAFEPLLEAVEKIGYTLEFEPLTVLAAPALWQKDDYGLWSITGKGCSIWLHPRPYYCDRGDWLAGIQVDDPRVVSVDVADGWPRYYFGLDVAKQQCEDWLSKRGLMPQPPVSPELVQSRTATDSLEHKSA